MPKRIVTLLASALLVLALAPSAVTAQGEKPKIGFLAGVVDPFYQVMELGVNAAVKDYGLEVVKQYPLSNYNCAFTNIRKMHPTPFSIPHDGEEFGWGGGRAPQVFIPWLVQTEGGVSTCAQRPSSPRSSHLFCTLAPPYRR